MRANAVAYDLGFCSGGSEELNGAAARAPALVPDPIPGRAASRHTSEMLEAQIKRIASALHDDAGQLLALIQIRLAEALGHVPHHGAGSFDEVQALLGQLETQLRRFSHELRPTILDDYGLVSAIEFLAAGFAQRTGVKVVFTSRLEGRLDSAAELTLYRVLQESLTNAGKHARATLVRIRMCSSGERVRCAIQDNGTGFDPGARGKRGLGLLGMRERVEGLGGALEVKSQPGRGTRVVVSLPRSLA
ncbi:MAG: sensor histidine kinase [Acidobacteriia bacterium]|nr:sensor histidine kinase [Terriglobia bacterium]